MTRVEPIETERLLLVSMTVELLRALSANDLDAARDAASFTLSEPCSLASKARIERRLALLEKDRAQQPWM